QTIDDFVDLGFLELDPLDVRQDLFDGGGAGRDGHYHVLEAVFNTLGDLDFAFAGEQFDRAHLAHVHADGIGGPAEVGVHGGQRGIGLFLSVVVVGRHRGV